MVRSGSPSGRCVVAHSASATFSLLRPLITRGLIHSPGRAGGETCRALWHRDQNYPSRCPASEASEASEQEALHHHRIAGTSGFPTPAPFFPVFRSPELCGRFPPERYSNGADPCASRCRLGTYFYVHAESVIGYLYPC